MHLMRSLALITLLGLSASCQPAERPAPTLDVIFAVESDPGVRLAGARVLVDGKPVGETDFAGVVKAKVSGQAGQQLTVEHDCPDDHVAPSEAKLLRLRNFERVGDPGAGSLEVTLRCPPSERLAVFIMRAKNGANLPVLLDGQSVGKTNASGVAHFSTSAIPGTDFVVELDTGNHPHLSPQRPTHLVTLPDADEIFVLTQSFDVPKGARRRAPRRKKITKIE